MNHLLSVFVFFPLILGFVISSSSVSEDKKSSGDVEMSATSSNIRHPKITISKETTYVEGPLRADGYVDYLAALNEYYSKDIIPENNAAIPFIKAVGPKDVEKETRKKYFQLLGIPELPDEGSYLVSIDDFIFQYKGWKGTERETQEAQEWSSKIWEQYEEASVRPWSKEEFPMLAALLEKNAGPLNLVVQGTRLARFYSPLVSKDDSLARCNLSVMMSSREINRLLILRAAFRMHSGDNDGAWEDILAGHRLAHLVSQGPLLIDWLVAAGVGRIVNSRAVKLMHYGNITTDQARRYQADLLKLQPMQPITQCVNKGERIFVLNELLNIAINGYKVPEIPPELHEAIKDILEESNKKSKLIDDAFQKSDNGSKIDWDEALRYTNNWYNRFIDAYNKPTESERKESVAKLAEAFSERKKKAINNMQSSNADNSDAKNLTRQFVDILGLMSVFDYPILNFENTNKIYMDLNFISLVLSGYRHDHKHYPESLMELCPKYIDRLPKDVYSGEDYRYKREGAGYLLYSVGPNGKDDGGKNFYQDLDFINVDESKLSEEVKAADDIAIRVPRKKE